MPYSSTESCTLHLSSKSCCSTTLAIKGASPPLTPNARGSPLPRIHEMIIGTGGAAARRCGGEGPACPAPAKLLVGEGVSTLLAYARPRRPSRTFAPRKDAAAAPTRV